MGTSSIKNNQRINRNEVDLFENAPYYQIVYSMGCFVGDFDKDCIAEHFINNPQGGAVAMISSTTKCYDTEIRELQYLLVYLYETIIHHQFNDPIEYRLGPLLNLCRNEKVFLSKNHLFGDPELPIWTREPVNLTVSTTPSVITNQNNVLTVSVSTMAHK